MLVVKRDVVVSPLQFIPACMNSSAHFTRAEGWGLSILTDEDAMADDGDDERNDGGVTGHMAGRGPRESAPPNRVESWRLIKIGQICRTRLSFSPKSQPAMKNF